MKKVGTGICRHTHFRKNHRFGTCFIRLVDESDDIVGVGAGVGHSDLRRGACYTEKALMHI